MTKVWISRPAARAAPLADALSAIGVSPYCKAAINILPLAPDDNSPLCLALAGYLKALDDYALSIFVSAHAAEIIRDRLPAIGTSNANDMATLPALAIGGQTAAALSPRYRLLQTRANNRTDSANTANITDSKALLNNPLLQHPTGKIAVLGGASPRHPMPAAFLCQTLGERGGDVHPIVCYHRQAAEKDAALDAAGKRGEFTAATAHSGDSLRAMQAMTAPDNTWLYMLPLFVIHPNIADTARQDGFQRVFTVPTADPRQLAEHIKAEIEEEKTRE